MNKICGVVDFDGFQVLGQFLVREFGFISTKWNQGRSYRYNLAPYRRLLSPTDWNTIRYVENHIFGLPFLHLKGESVYRIEDLDDDIWDFYVNCRSNRKKVIAYKGGSVEKDRLDYLNIPSVNLESFGCPRYDQLQSERYNRLSCGYHVDDLHCPRAEVTAFKDWVCDHMDGELCAYILK